MMTQDFFYTRNKRVSDTQKLEVHSKAIIQALHNLHAC